MLAYQLGYSRTRNTRQAYTEHLLTKEAERPKSTPYEASVDELQAAAKKAALILDIECG